MTEQEWLECDDPMPMWEYLRGKANDRKCRLLAVASIRRVAMWFNNDAKVNELLLGAAEAGEQYADNTLPPTEFKRLRDRFHFYTQLGALSDAQRFAGEAVTLLFADAPDEAAYGITFAADAVTELTEGLPPATTTSRERELAAQAALVRDVFGNPFTPVSLDSEWRNLKVRSLALAAYDERSLPEGILNPARLAILAGALEDAGCVNDDILDHLRGSEPHVRGCWAVDNILDRR